MFPSSSCGCLALHCWFRCCFGSAVVILVHIIRRCAARFQQFLVGTLVGQLSRCFAHIKLAGHGIGDETGAVFAEQFDLATAAGDTTIYAGGGLIEEAGDGGLFGEGWHSQAHALELSGVDVDYGEATAPIAAFWVIADWQLVA
ncbi:MAG: hypothetical protein M2R45_00402 [Verrucomicrobia subdivision 3 bacterium]|nr:hypothetical protein [Limisphaerales bacterium]MCS1412839.1 hypothetical protein [Limisphaerales bacterium]